MNKHVSDLLHEYYQTQQDEAAVIETVANTFSRRSFLKAAGIATGGLVVGVSIPNISMAKTTTAEFNPNAFIHLSENGDLLIYCARCEMGQGISTALPAVVADEMEADWNKVTIEQAEGNEEKFGSQATGGSASIRKMYEPMRIAGASAKEMLIAAAAKVWSVKASDCYAENHFVINKLNNKKLGYGELASLAANIEVPASPTLKTKDQFKYIGKDLDRHDQGKVVVGKRTYGVDTKLPGMKYAAVVHCPVFGGKLESVNKDKAMQVKGVTDVVIIEPIAHPFSSVGAVAVVADNSWTAQKAAKLLEIKWLDGDNKVYNTKEYKAALVKSVEQPAQLAAERGDVDAALKNAKHVVKATYTGGHLCHAPMEPNASVVSVTDTGCEVWASTQSPGDIQKVLGQYLEREPASIKVNVMMAGGAFGRKFKCDYVHEAAVISKQIKAPVQLIWSREEDMRTGYYHSVNAQHIEASLDENGNVTGWLHRAAFPPIASLFNPSLDRAPANALGEIKNHPFNIPNMRSESGKAVAHTRIGWYRAVNAIFYGFAYGTFADELAHKANKPTVEFLNDLYDSNLSSKQNKKSRKHKAQVSRSKAVLALAAKHSGIGKELPKGEGIGIAVHYSFQSYVAMAVHVKVDGDNIKVLNVDCAIDCGQTLNTDGATAQMEGAVVMGMSLALATEITFKDGAVVNSNFHNYPVMRISDMPNVRVHIIDSDEKPTGLGEPGVAPFAPALSNAIFAASGKRYRDLPMKPMPV